MKRKKEKGVALILTLILLAVLSVMAVSLMFIGRAETWSSMNYRMMTQARYGAEAGVNAAANWIQNSYTAPITTAISSMASARWSRGERFIARSLSSRCLSSSQNLAAGANTKRFARGVARRW